MAEGQEVTRAQRLLTTAAVALMAATAAVGLGRVFIGRDASIKLAFAAVAAVALAGLVRRRPVVVSALISLAALVIVLGWQFFAHTTFYGIPTLATLDGLRNLAGLASSEIRTQIAPTVALGGLMIAALTGVWMAAWASHSIAARAGAPLLASLPCLALFTFGDVIVDEGSRPGYYVVMLSSLVVLLFADGIRRVGSWGPLEVWTGPSRRAGSPTLRATKGARGIAASVVLFAALLPGILPGWERDSVLNPQSLPGRGTSVNPFVTLQANLRKNPSEELFVVTTARPSYWRMLSLDIFDGSTWSTQDLELYSAVDIGEGGSLRPVGSVAGSTVTLRQDFEMVALASPWLPMAWEPSSISAPGQDIRYNPELSIAIGPDEPAGTLYTVESTLVAPTSEQMDAAVAPHTPDQPTPMPPSTYERYTMLPAQIPSVAREFALRATRDQPNDYRKMLALQQALRDNFTYDEDAQTPAGANPLEWFLTGSQAGYCQQFAGSMAVMARSLGYPARVAVGFLPGLDAGIDRWTVTTAQSHAWPEIWFDGIGWVPFEPTPGRDNPVAMSYLSPAALGSTAADGVLNRGGRGLGRGQDLDGLRWKGRHGGDLGVEFAELPAPGPQRSFPLVPVLLLLLLGIALIPPTKWLSHRWRLRRSRPPRDLVLATYSVFEEGASEMGLARAPADTLLQHRDALTERLPTRAEEIGRLVEATSKAAYSPIEPRAGAADQVASDARVIVRELRRATPLAQRAKGAFQVKFR